MDTSNEQFHAKDIDMQIEQALAQARPNEPNAQLVADLQQLYQADVQADRQSLNYAWQHIRARRRSQRSQNAEGKIIPMYLPSSHNTIDKMQGGPYQQHFSSLRRALGLIAAVLVAALVVGSLLAVLYQARLAQNGNTGTPSKHQPTTPPTQVHPGRVVSSHKVKDNTVMGLQWSPDGKRLVLVGNDAHIWDATTGKNEKTYHPSGGGTSPIQNVAWAPDGSQRVAIATDTVQVVDANTAKILSTGPKSPTANMGNLLTSVLTPLLSHSQGSPAVRAVAWSPDGRYIASSPYDPNTSSQSPQDHPILIWNSDTGTIVKTLLGHTADVESLAWSPDGKYLASLSQNWDQSVRVWDAKTGTLVHTIHAKDYGAMYALAWSPDSQYLAVSMSVQVGNNTTGEIQTQNQIQIWKALTGTSIRTYTSGLSDSDEVQYLAWSHDGTRIASVENGQQTSVCNVNIWDPMTGKTLFTYQEKSGELRGVTWSPNDTLIATARMSSLTPPDQQTNNDTIDVKVWEAPAK